MSIGRAGTGARSLIEADLQRVRTTLRELWTDAPECLRPLILSGSLDGGKLLRPSLLLLSGGLFGVVTADHIRAAAVLEMVHSASLLHDDVLDQGLVRRGMPTLNRRWGNRAAVLLGDLVLAKAFEWSAPLAADIRATLARAIGRTCDGEIQQTTFAGDFQITERRYLRILGHKTAALFKGACLLGARLAGAARRECRLLGHFGFNAGMAYQIMDDLLDITGDRKVLRKTLGTDVQKAKATLPVIRTLGAMDHVQRESLLQRLEDHSLGIRELARMIVETGSRAYVLGRANACASRAAMAVQHLPRSPARTALLALLRNYCHATRPVAVQRAVAGQL